MTHPSPRGILDELAAALDVTEPVPLAQGGQKFVLRALRRGLPVAVKAMLVPPGPAFTVALERAGHETAVLAAVDSPRVVRLLDEPRVLTYDGHLPYGVAWTEELLDGDDLDKLLGVPWDPAQAARLLTHLAEAIAALHEKGIVHRDLTPANVRRRRDGSYCLMDPGLARFLSEPDPGDGDRIGTIGYRSPEHASNSAVGTSSDVFCVGILVHQALTGRPPVDPRSTREQERARLAECAFPAADTLRPEVPELLSRVVERCLHPDPERRFADGRALLDELERHGDVFVPFFAQAEAAAAVPGLRLDPPTPMFGPGALSFEAAADRTVVMRGAFGERRLTADSIAADQEPFAVRLSPYVKQLAPGLMFAARTIELGDGRITNSYELTVDPSVLEVRAHSDPEGFHLPELLDGDTLAAISGSFSFISDDARYQPAEPCLDLCVRDGVVVSIPTAVKPALLVGRDGLSLRTLDARGTLSIDEREYGWVGSKAGEPFTGFDDLVAFGAANCRMRYTPAERTGFLRDVDPSGNRTAPDEDAVDLVVARQGSTLRVAALRPGGGTDLFEGCFVLRGHRERLRAIEPGAAVRIRSVDGVDCSEIESGFSVGPSVAAAAKGEGLAAYDESLGLSPFLPGTRYARTLIGLADGLLHLRVFDGAPLTRGFQGVSCAEVARLIEADGLDPEHFHHLDGVQSSKLAVRSEASMPAVPGHEAAAIFGSMHYLLWPKQGEGAFEWRGTHGRLLRSALRVTVRR